MSVIDGVRLVDKFDPAQIHSGPSTELIGVLSARQDMLSGPVPGMAEQVVARALVLPRSKRWAEAAETALIGDWCSPLWDSGHLPLSSLGALKAQIRSTHRQLVPVWRRRTRQGRVLSLDADLGGLSLHDLVATDVDMLARAAGRVFEDERLNAVLRGLDPVERLVVFAYAEHEGTNWTEAAAIAGAADPKAFGNRVRRKAQRLAAEQRRRLALRRGIEQTHSS